MQNKGPAADIDLDFDLGGDTSQAAASTPDFVLDSTASVAPAPAGGNVDFDLGFDSPAAPAAPAARPAAPETDFSPSGTLIIDSPVSMDPMGNAEKTVEMSPVGIPDAPTEESGNEIDFDFDIGGGAPSLPAASAAPAAAAAPAGNSMDFDLSSISLDLPGGGDAGGNGAIDDAATKLDLAKAYQEMGDKDGAKELLGEVMKEGSATQKAEAQQLLSAI